MYAFYAVLPFLTEEIPMDYIHIHHIVTIRDIFLEGHINKEIPLYPKESPVPVIFSSIILKMIFYNKKIIEIENVMPLLNSIYAILLIVMLPVTTYIITKRLFYLLFQIFIKKNANENVNVYVNLKNQKTLEKTIVCSILIFLFASLRPYVFSRFMFSLILYNTIVFVLLRIFYDYRMIIGYILLFLALAFSDPAFSSIVFLTLMSFVLLKHILKMFYKFKNVSYIENYYKIDLSAKRLYLLLLITAVIFSVVYGYYSIVLKGFIELLHNIMSNIIIAFKEMNPLYLHSITGLKWSGKKTFITWNSDVYPFYLGYNILLLFFVFLALGSTIKLLLFFKKHKGKALNGSSSGLLFFIILFYICLLIFGMGIYKLVIALPTSPLAAYFIYTILSKKESDIAKLKIKMIYFKKILSVIFLSIIILSSVNVFLYEDKVLNVFNSGETRERVELINYLHNLNSKISEKIIVFGDRSIILQLYIETGIKLNYMYIYTPTILSMNSEEIYKKIDDFNILVISDDLSILDQLWQGNYKINEIVKKLAYEEYQSRNIIYNSGAINQFNMKKTKISPLIIQS